MRETKKHRRIYEESIRQFDKIQLAEQENRAQCLEDRRFVMIAGAQWEGSLAKQFENKPRMEVNKVALATTKIINEYRNNPITVDFKSKDGKNAENLADTCDGLFRADLQMSGADEAFDNGFSEAVEGGLGAWRLTTEYVNEKDPEDDRQVIRIEPIFDADQLVFWDPDARRQDKSDANYCFLLTPMSPDAYVDAYGDEENVENAGATSWPKIEEYNNFDWYTHDVVYIAEKYVKETTYSFVHIYEHMTGGKEYIPEEELDDRLEVLNAVNAKELRVKKIPHTRVRKYILSGAQLLEDAGYIAGENIPIVPVYGRRGYIDNLERYMGHVRFAKDPQRLKNMQISKLAEISATSPVEKPIFTPEQMKGHEATWKNDNVENYAYLLVNAITDANGNKMPAGPIAYTKPPQVPPTMAALLQITEQDMKDILGNADNAEKMVSNVSTETTSIIQHRLDMQTYIYVSNMKKAMQRTGEIWLSMAQEVYVEEGREMLTVDSHNELGKIELSVLTVNDKGEKVFENDLAHADMLVIADVGPASSTQKNATVRALMDMLNLVRDPETASVISHMVLMNMEGEGIGEARAFFRKKLVQMGVIKPTDEEAQAMAQAAANRQPSAQDQYLQAAAAKEQAEAVEKQANTLLKQAQVDETRADTAKTIAEIEQEGRKIQQDTVKIALDAINKIGPRVNPPELEGFPVEGN